MVLLQGRCCQSGFLKDQKEEVKVVYLGLPFFLYSNSVGEVKMDSKLD